MENLLDLIETTAKESLKGLEGSDKEDLENLLLDIEDQRTIEHKAEALNISLEQFAGTPTERETIEAKIYALKIILNLLSFKAEKLNA